MGAPAPHAASSAAAPASTFVPENSTSIPAPVSVQSGRAANQTMITMLENAATAVDRYALLPLASDHLFDFNNSPDADAVTTGLDGHLVTANRKSFPALIGTGGSMSVGFIVQGSLLTKFIIENKGTLIRNRLNQYQMSVFPQGAIHTEFNQDCTAVVFVAGFPSEDAGTPSVTQRLFDLDDDVLRAKFNSEFTFKDGRDPDQFRNRIPESVANGVASCLQKCNISNKIAFIIL